MIKVTPFFALVTFVVIVVASMVVAYMYKSQSFEKSKIHIFLVTLAGLGIVITFLFYYSVVSLQQQQQRIAIIDETARLTTFSISSLLDEMRTASKTVPNFINSINPLNPCGSIIPPEDPFNSEACTERYILSYRIFAIWQDFLISSGFIDYEEIPYLTSFLQRANSKLLYDQWNISQYDFNSTTQKFGNLLFKYALPITEQTTESYKNTAIKLSKDPEFISLK